MRKKEFIKNCAYIYPTKIKIDYESTYKIIWIKDIKEIKLIINSS